MTNKTILFILYYFINRVSWVKKKKNTLLDTFPMYF
jgi:hypothetical protein